MKNSTSVLPFKERYDLEKRIKMREKALNNKPDLIFVVIQKNVSCSFYPKLTSNLFLAGKFKTTHNLKEELKDRLSKMMEVDLSKYSLFLHTKTTLLNSDQKLFQVYETCKNSEDKILYLQYSSVNPF